MGGIRQTQGNRLRGVSHRPVENSVSRTDKLDSSHAEEIKKLGSLLVIRTNLARGPELRRSSSKTNIDLC